MTRDDAVYDICEGIKNEKIVPILGDNAFRVRYKNSSVSLQQYIVYSLLEEDGTDVVKEFCSKSFLRCMKDLEKLLPIRGGELRRDLNKLFDSQSFKDGLFLKEKLKDLLIKGNFKLIILASLLPAEVVKRLLANDCKGMYNPIMYRTEQRQDISLNQEIIARPTLFQLFGGFDFYGKCVITEKDYLIYLHCLHDTNTQPVSLRKYLADKHILAIGCEMPDWTFRFMLYSLKGDGDKIGNTNVNQFGGGVADNSLDPNLVDFLEDIHYYPDEDVFSLLELICDRLPNTTEKPGLFLSYSADVYSQDYKNILHIKNVLDERFEVYFFPDNPERNKGGFQYWQDIEDALQRCSYFMPVITNKLLRKFDKTTVQCSQPQKDIQGEPGFVSEWKIALMNKFEKIFPYRIDVDLEDFKGSLERSDKEIFYPLFHGWQHITVDPSDFTVDELSL